jgi:adhesin transport system membrane fusion protein
MELSDIQARSTLGQEQAKLDALRGREARLVAELYGHDAIRFPPGLSDRDVMRAETDAWRARRARLAEEVRVLRDQGAQKRGELAESGSRRENLLAELEVSRKQYRVIEGLRRNGAASELEVLESQSRMQRLETQMAEAAASQPRLRAAQAETESRVSEVVARFRAEASAELTQVRADLEKSNLEVGSNADRLERNSVRAPVSGFINRLAVTTVGGVVRPGEVLMEITPDDQRVVLETRARPNDRANLRRGLPARVKIGAYDYATFGTMEGEVTEVSADTLTDEREGRYYRVRVEARSPMTAQSNHSQREESCTTG